MGSGAGFPLWNVWWWQPGVGLGVVFFDLQFCHWPRKCQFSIFHSQFSIRTGHYSAYFDVVYRVSNHVIYGFLVEQECHIHAVVASWSPAISALYSDSGCEFGY